MPPAKSGKQLSAGQIALLKRWIEEGASWDSHWAFTPIMRRALPEVKRVDWPTNDIDYFILHRLEREGMYPSPAADKATLIRRLSLTLLGLPPSPAEVDAFLRDNSVDAYDKLVERLLRSPHYGEHMAQAWLDWARFADSRGQNYDRKRTMWPWRDWVIRAFNTNMPFDQFSIEQLAGDLLASPSNDQLLATGFHRNVVRDADGDSPMDLQENRVTMLSDMVNTTAAVWLGLTFQCAQCHDHKHDPISQRDYYRLYAFFNKQARELAGATADQYGNSPPTVEISWRRNRSSAATTVSAMVMRDADDHPETHVLLRGEFNKLGEKVFAGVPAFLNIAMSPDRADDRLGLARWLMNANNPLPSRVIVNRLWELVFGAGIVKTSEDFGNQGEPPTHPELLDWLAHEFVASGWDVKKLLQLMVRSSTFRQASTVCKESIAADPTNLYYARYRRNRLSGEAIRDNALAISGLLDRSIGGPPTFPILPASEIDLFNQALGGIRPRSMCAARAKTCTAEASISFTSGPNSIRLSPSSTGPIARHARFAGRIRIRRCKHLLC